MEANVRSNLRGYESACFVGLSGAGQYDSILQRGFYADATIAAMPAEEREALMAHGPADASWQSDFGPPRSYAASTVPPMAIARCIVAANPREALALVSSTAFSPEEDAAMEPIAPRLRDCSPVGVRVNISRQPLRALIADAMYQYLRASRAAMAAPAAAPTTGAPR